MFNSQFTLICKQKNFSGFHIFLVLTMTLLFAVPTCFQENPNLRPNESALILSTLLYAFICLLLVIFCLTNLKTTFSQTFLSPRFSTRQAIGKGIIYSLVTIPPVLLLAMLSTALFNIIGIQPQQQAVFDWLTDKTYSHGSRMIMLIAVVVIAPIIEELLFRGIIFTTLFKTRSFLYSASLSGLYFTLIHFTAVAFPPLLLLSFAFCAGYAMTGSILTPMVMHLIFNLTSLIVYFSTKG